MTLPSNIKQKLVKNLYLNYLKPTIKFQGLKPSMQKLLILKNI
jgi:hypothetical protein